MERNKTKKLVLAGVMIALAQILSYVKVLDLPYGGSVTAASMVPIIIFALVYGLKEGLMTAFAYGFLQFILGGGIAIHPLSILLDYLLGFGVLGLAGVFHSNVKDIKKALAGTLLAGLLRFLMVFLSGIIVWGSYAPEGMEVWYYSLTYNGTYMIPEIIVSLVVVFLIYSKVYDALRK